MNTSSLEILNLEWAEVGKSIDIEFEIAVGLFGTYSITRVWASHPDFWRDVVAGSYCTIYACEDPKDGVDLEGMGIKEIPSDPGEYNWKGTYTITKLCEKWVEYEYKGTWRSLKLF